MRNTLYDKLRGVSPLGRRMAGLVTANQGNNCLYFPLSEGAGTNISDLGGRAVNLPLAGVTTGAWAVPSDGLNIASSATGTDIITAGINGSTVSAEVIAAVNQIYACPTSMDNTIIYAGLELTMAAAPASDVNNYVFSMGMQDSVGADTKGQLCLRINANLKPAWHLKTRETTSINEYGVDATALTAGTRATIFTAILPGSTTNVLFYRNGALNGNPSLDGLDSGKGPIADTTAGIVLFGRGSNASSTATSRLGTVGAASANTNPKVRNLIIGRCSYSTDNLTRLEKLARELHYNKRLPHWFGDID